MATTAPATPQTNPIGFRAVRRRIADSMDGARVDGDDPQSLEGQRLAPADPPRLARANPIEHPVIRRCQVAGEPTVGFVAFLDGIQASRIVLHDDSIPIVHGVIGAVIRERVDRRLGTWRYEAEERVYAPRAFLTPASDAAIADLGLDVVDITPRKQGGGEPDDDARHPLSLADIAVSAVQAHREALELRLAAAWIDARSEPLYVDGNISGGAQLAASPFAVGVVKSHRTLYGDAQAVRTILKLAAGERSTVFAVSSPNGWRSAVASWYLRLRESANPLWGLVRVEVSMPSDADRPALGSRADQISRWILAEASPLSLPDSRWDTMAYGIRDCEQFLRSILR
jgi:hypothetical protein